MRDAALCRLCTTFGASWVNLLLCAGPAGGTHWLILLVSLNWVITLLRPVNCRVMPWMSFCSHFLLSGVRLMLLIDPLQGHIKTSLCHFARIFAEEDIVCWQPVVVGITVMFRFRWDMFSWKLLGLVHVFNPFLHLSCLAVGSFIKLWDVC